MSYGQGTSTEKTFLRVLILKMRIFNTSNALEQFFITSRMFSKLVKIRIIFEFLWNFQNSKRRVKWLLEVVKMSSWCWPSGLRVQCFIKFYFSVKNQLIDVVETFRMSLVKCLLFSPWISISLVTIFLSFARLWQELYFAGKARPFEEF